MDRKIINIIPPDYKGNPRNALGYPWKKIVQVRDSWTDEQKAADPWGGLEKTAESIPGEDRIGGYDAILAAKAEIEEEYPGVRWGSDRFPPPDDAEYVAVITGMWCGSQPEYGYIGGTPGKKVQTTENPGEELHETAAIIALNERIEGEEMDAANKGQPGWCSKCHSYCYGDCETA